MDVSPVSRFVSRSSGMSVFDPVVTFRDARLAYPDGGFDLRVDRFDVAAGETVALVGPSGSGKSTMLRAIAGLLLAEGELTVLGEGIAEYSDARRRRFRRERLGISLQPFALLDALTVEENVLLTRHLGASVDDEANLRSEARRLLAAVGIERFADRKPAKLSHGERQRVALCRALALGRPLTLLDEPTASLDPASKRSAMTFAVEETRRSGGALLVVTHDANVLDAFDRVVEIGDCTTVVSIPAEAT